MHNKTPNTLLFVSSVYKQPFQHEASYFADVNFGGFNPGVSRTLTSLYILYANECSHTTYNEGSLAVAEM